MIVTLSLTRMHQTQAGGVDSSTTSINVMAMCCVLQLPARCCARCYAGLAKQPLPYTMSRRGAGDQLGLKEGKCHLNNAWSSGVTGSSST